MAPYSSSTIAICWWVRRNSTSSAPRFLVSGMNSTGRSSSSIVVLSRLPVVVGGEDVADVQHADHVVEGAAVDGVARVGGVDDDRQALA